MPENQTNENQTDSDDIFLDQQTQPDQRLDEATTEPSPSEADRPEPDHAQSDQQGGNCPALASLKAKYAIVRDFVIQLVMGIQTALIIEGRGGIGKSFTVLRALRDSGASFKVWNTHMTPKGLFYALQENPDAIHVFEDMEHVFRSQMTAAVLRAAMWSQEEPDQNGKLPRTITWGNFAERESFIFYGAVCFLSNSPFDANPEMRAVGTRSSHFELTVADEEVAALMREIAKDGFDNGRIQLSAPQCRDVTEYLIEHSATTKLPLDLRMQGHGYCDFYAHDQGQTTTHWQQLLQTRLQERPVVDVPVPKKMEMNEELDLLERLLTEFPETAKERFMEATGFSSATYGRRLKKLRGRRRRIAA